MNKAAAKTTAVQTAELARQALQASGADQHDQACRLLKKALKLNPNSAPLHYNLALELRADGRFPQARGALQKASALNPEDADAPAELGLLEIQLENWSLAEEALKTALSRNPRHPAALNNSGVLAFLQKNYSKAENFFRQALEVNPENPEAWFNLADTLDLLKQPEAAAEARRQYETRKPARGNTPSALPRAEELIAEVYRQIIRHRENGRQPTKILMSPAKWEIINRYRLSLGSLSGPLPDYLAENTLFGLEIWYDDGEKIQVE